MQTSVDQIADRVSRISTCIPEVAPYRRLADLWPRTLAVMHGSSYKGDCPVLLRTLAEVYAQRYGCSAGAVPVQPPPAHALPVG